MCNDRCTSPLRFQCDEHPGPFLWLRLVTDPIINFHGKLNPWLSSAQFYYIFLESTPSCFSVPSLLSQSRNSSLATCITAPVSYQVPLLPGSSSSICPSHSRLGDLSAMCIWCCCDPFPRNLQWQCAFWPWWFSAADVIAIALSHRCWGKFSHPLKEYLLNIHCVSY